MKNWLHERECPLCLRWDCDCKDILEEVEFNNLVNEYNPPKVTDGLDKE